MELAGNYSEIESLLHLHSVLTRYKNYTQEAKSSCVDDSNDIYSYAAQYKDWHGYVSIFVCIFGVISNSLIMAVLRRKEMHTPVNLMLLALAVADLLIMTEYVPFALHMYIRDDRNLEEKYSHASAIFVLFHVHFSQILHTVSIQLTLTMAIWRYSAVKCNNRSSSLCTFKRCHQTIIAAYVCPVFFCILNYLYFEIIPRVKYITHGPPPFNHIDGNNEEELNIFKIACKATKQDCSLRKVVLYIVESSDLVREYPVLHTIHFWTFSVLIKLIPCVVLTFFMGWMINTLYKARCHQKVLEQDSGLALRPLGRNSGYKPPMHSNNTSILCVSPTQSMRVVPSANVEETSKNLDTRYSLIVPSNTDSTSRKSSWESVQINEFKETRFSARNLISIPKQRRRAKSCKRTIRTSKMLIVVLMLFLLTEFPQGVMHLLTGWHGPDFFRCKYNPLAEIWDIVALVNSSINFILYCFMSKKFRQQFHIFLTQHFPTFKWSNSLSWKLGSGNNKNGVVSTTF